MLRLAFLCGVLAVTVAPAPAEAMSLNQACARFASRLDEAVKSGDMAKAQEVYKTGTKRVASRFNGASCPDVKPPVSAK
jgi:hypothetical protein